MAQMLLPVPHVPQRQPGECLAACAAMLLLYAPIQVSRGDFDLAWLARDEYYAVITPRI